MRKPDLVLGMKFPNSKVFREALREYVVNKAVDIKFKLNEKTKISVYCKNDCGWRLYTSVVPGELTFQIKTFQSICTCGKSFQHSQVVSSYVARKYLQDFGKNPKWEMAEVQHHVRQDISVELNRNQVYRAKRKAREILEGDEKLQYVALWDYAIMIKKTNMGTADCRPIIGLDGCHLKGRFGGQLLTATARDGNDNMFLVALVVVEQECKDSWIWFLKHFSEDIGHPQNLNLVFISDRQKV